MSKYVKNLITSDIKNRLEGINDAVVANCIGMNSDSTYKIRKLLRDKGISMLVVKRSLATRAVADSSLSPLFDDLDGSVAIVYGCEDFVSLCKEMAAITKIKEFEKFELKGGVMDGEPLSGPKLLEVAKWPNRQEQIALLVGKILSPGSTLSAQCIGPASQIAGQVKKLIENKEGEA